MHQKHPPAKVVFSRFLASLITEVPSRSPCFSIFEQPFTIIMDNKAKIVNAVHFMAIFYHKADPFP